MTRAPKYSRLMELFDQGIAWCVISIGYITPFFGIDLPTTQSRWHRSSSFHFPFCPLKVRFFGGGRESSATTVTYHNIRKQGHPSRNMYGMLSISKPPRIRTDNTQRTCAKSAVPYRPHQHPENDLHHADHIKPGITRPRNI